MFVLFGNKEKEKNYGPALPVVCPNCQNATWLQLIEVEKWASLFFIPFAQYDSLYVLACPICSRGIELTEKQFERARRLVRAARAWRENRISEERYRGVLEETRLLPAPDETRMVRLRPQGK